ncbi:HNH/ENDO VII superfamily nuclease [Sinobacterium caligoides]|uniref:HNH/ENDO VII superfamily nuclease n=1 Tax=Sinobacterium caligoides TaxID=933926 RepID=A0A3N2DK71_9GAMM|nr:AHH domain-containing protein [Sinobacterium caligoides]ROS00204.1 HNH/ENDO VII superfamily nuclease [Sinobacterium caligoides]
MPSVNHAPNCNSSPLESALHQFKQHLGAMGKSPTVHQKRHIELEEGLISNLAQVEQRLEEYEGWVRQATASELREEGHNSKRLGRNLRAAGRAKPDDRCDAHAIVSGKHKYSRLLRITLSMRQIGVDEADNGCWLPRSWSKDRNHWALSHAVPHSRIHRKSYYRWLEIELPMRLTSNQLREKLRTIGRLLQQNKSEIPSWVREWEE